MTDGVDDDFNIDYNDFYKNPFENENEEEYNDEDDEDGFFFSKTDKQNNLDDRQLSYTQNSDTVSLKDVELKNFIDNDRDLKLKSLSMLKLNNTSEPINTAMKITKNIFDSTNSKLSMEIFDKINIGILFLITIQYFI